MKFLGKPPKKNQKKFHLSTVWAMEGKGQQIWCVNLYKVFFLANIQ